MSNPSLPPCPLARGFSSVFELLRERSSFPLSPSFIGEEREGGGGGGGREGEIGSRRGWNLVGNFFTRVPWNLLTGFAQASKKKLNHWQTGTLGQARRQPLDPAGSAMENSYVERHESGGPEERETIEDSRRGARVALVAGRNVFEQRRRSCYKFATMLTL